MSKIEVAIRLFPRSWEGEVGDLKSKLKNFVANFLDWRVAEVEVSIEWDESPTRCGATLLSEVRCRAADVEDWQLDDICKKVESELRKLHSRKLASGFGFIDVVAIRPVGR